MLCIKQLAKSMWSFNEGAYVSALLQFSSECIHVLCGAFYSERERFGIHKDSDLEGAGDSKQIRPIWRQEVSRAQFEQKRSTPIPVPSKRNSSLGVTGNAKIADQKEYFKEYRQHPHIEL
jgi:hypothetical protein